MSTHHSSDGPLRNVFIAAALTLGITAAVLTRPPIVRYITGGKVINIPICKFASDWRANTQNRTTPYAVFSVNAKGEIKFVRSYSYAPDDPRATTLSSPQNTQKLVLE